MVFRAAAMASRSASWVRALADLKNSFTFDHIFSIGFKSGEYGGRNRTSAPTEWIKSRASLSLCADRLSITTMSPGLSVGSRTCRTYSRNTSPVVAPSMAMQAVLPSRRIDEIIVVVHQWPHGASSIMRWPPFARPRRRVIFVFAPDSSRDTSFDKSHVGCSACH